MSVNAVMRELEQKQRHCTRLQAAIQAATQDLTQALSKRDSCRDRLDREIAVGQSMARQTIRARLTAELQHAQGEVARAAGILDRKRAVLGGAQRGLYEYRQKVTATYTALREHVPEEIVELMSSYIFSPDPDA